jgi:uncharacterized iron-regulated membrane protein
MSKSFRQSQTLLHTWSGLLMGWLLFVVFVAGTIAYWREDLNRWMRPALDRVEQPYTVLAGAQSFLQREVPGAKTWYITMASERSPGAQLFWVPQPTATQPAIDFEDNQALIDAHGDPVTTGETRGGDFFYRLHFDLHYMPVIWARWLVGLAAMAMLVAILTGIVAHKKIFKDFFTLRRGKGQRSWLDGHNATAVLALPFHLMITYTGLVTLMAMLMPWAVVANYVDPTAIYATQFPEPPPATRTGHAAPLADLVSVARDAERRFGAPVGYMDVSDPGDRAARINVTRASDTMLSSRTPRLTYDGVSGELIWQAPAPGGAAVTAGAMIGLHAGRYAGDALRWIYFLCGVAGSLMVGSGLVMWIVKRREKLPDPARPHLGFRIVERLNVAVVGGFPASIAVMFWANRLLPPTLAERAETEIACLFLSWLAALVLAVALRPARMWVALLTLTGALLSALPLYDIVATRRGLIDTILEGDHVLAAADVTLLVFGLAYLATARRVAAYRRPDRRARRARATAARVMQFEPAE